MKKDDIKKLNLLSIHCFGIETEELNSEKRKNINSAMSQIISENNVSFSNKIMIHQSEEKLWSGLRKSFKKSINWGLRELDIDVCTKSNINLDIVESFRKLHIQEAGKETRSRKSWLLQLQAVRENEAFIVTGKKSGELVSAGYFIINKNHCFYGSSASKYKQFKKPLFHSLVWNAILHCKKREIIFFEMGLQYSKQQILENKIDSKIVNIANFKSGFGGRLINKSYLRRSSY